VVDLPHTHPPLRVGHSHCMSLLAKKMKNGSAHPFHYSSMRVKSLLTGQEPGTSGKPQGKRLLRSFTKYISCLCVSSRVGDPQNRLGILQRRQVGCHITAQHLMRERQEWSSSTASARKNGLDKWIQSSSSYILLAFGVTLD
jgi:hypothetical protein